VRRLLKHKTGDPLVTLFHHALLRHPANSAIHGLRDVDRGAPNIESLKAEHAGYVQALEQLGVSTTVLDADEAFPDSMFVEDPALVFSTGAILLRPGAPSRFGETQVIGRELASRFNPVLVLKDGHSDGGDVLLTSDHVIIGLSARTNTQGAEALSAALAKLGRQAKIVTPPPGVLHFKTACSLVSAKQVLTTKQLIDGGDYFGDLDVIEVPAGEEAAANALCVNGTVLLADGFPKTRAKLEGLGLTVKTLALDETMKLDAGLSCMSLRWA